MADKTTTNFPTMGTENANAVNISGAPSPNTTLVPKGHSKDSDNAATASIRPHSYERNGFKGAPQMNHVYDQAPEATQTGRNVRLFASAVGNRDFYAKRAFGQVAQ